jgi:hypothetical protein
LADVPWLGDQLGLADHRVLCDEVEEGGAAVEGAGFAGEGRRKVEAEPVDLHLREPVAQRVHDQLKAVAVVGVERVPAAGRVDVDARVVGIESVVRRVVQAAMAQRRSLVVALGRVVVHDVEEDLQTGVVECPHHRLELRDLAAASTHAGRGRVALVGGEEADRVVPPVVG